MGRNVKAWNNMINVGLKWSAGKSNFLGVDPTRFTPKHTKKRTKREKEKEKEKSGHVKLISNEKMLSWNWIYKIEPIRVHNPFKSTYVAPFLLH